MMPPSNMATATPEMPGSPSSGTSSIPLPAGSASILTTSFPTAHRTGLAIHRMRGICRRPKEQWRGLSTVKQRGENRVDIY